MESLYISTLWIVYYFLHSALATDRIKGFFKNNFPALVESYRFFYSLFSIVNFVLLGWLHWLIDSPEILSPSNWLTGIAIFLGWTGIGVVMIALRSYPSGFWFGNPKQEHLVISGLNSWVRHPLYLGTLFILIAFVLWAPSLKNLLFVIISIIYLILGSYLEEQKLLDQYGKEYADYRERVNMILPFIF